jgi:pimeloyl-ACP methyl ester carboxylesterase
MSIQTRTTTVNGLNIRYLEGGTTDHAPILFLHGALGDAAFHWNRLLPLLADQYYVVAPDLPGFGDSASLSPLTYEALVGWTNDLMDALDINQAVIVGNSLGGLVGRLFAAHAPHRVPALILINGGVLPGKAAGVAKMLAGLPGISDFVFSIFSRQGVGSRDALDWVVMNHEDTEVLTDQMVEIAAANVPALTSVMKMQVLSPVPEKRVPTLPTLLLWGTNDTLSPVSAGEKVHKAIPGSIFRKIDETKHAPHIEEPEVISFQIESYLKELNRPKPASNKGVGSLG